MGFPLLTLEVWITIGEMAELNRANLAELVMEGKWIHVEMGIGER